MLGDVPSDQVPSHLAIADIFVFASAAETQGMVVLEAMAAGLPVVAVNSSASTLSSRPAAPAMPRRRTSRSGPTRCNGLMVARTERESMGAAAREAAAKYSIEAFSEPGLVDLPGRHRRQPRALGAMRPSGAVKNVHVQPFRDVRCPTQHDASHRQDGRRAVIRRVLDERPLCAISMGNRAALNGGARLWAGCGWICFSGKTLARHQDARMCHSSGSGHGFPAGPAASKAWTDIVCSPNREANAPTGRTNVA